MPKRRLRPWQQKLLRGTVLMLIVGSLLFFGGVLGLFWLTPLGWPWLTTVVDSALLAGMILLLSSWIAFALVRL